MADMTATGPVDTAFLEDFGNRWLDAWNGHQPDVLLALMTDDIVYDDSAWPTTMRGHAEVREFLEHTWRAFPDLTFDLVDGPFAHPEQPKAAYHWSGTGTHTGPIDPPGLAATGKRMQFEGVDFHTYRDGKVARLQIVFDMAEAMRQLGTLPPAGSRGERVMVRLGNLGTKLRR